MKIHFTPEGFSFELDTPTTCEGCDVLNVKYSNETSKKLYRKLYNLVMTSTNSEKHDLLLTILLLYCTSTQDLKNEIIKERWDLLDEI